MRARGEHLTLERIGGEVSVAPSCLISPADGDLALWRREGGRVFIEAILERPKGPNAGSARMHFAGGASMEARRGSIRLKARSTKLLSDERVRGLAQQVAVASAGATVRLREGLLVVDRLRTRVKHIELASRATSWFSERTRQAMARSYRTVEALDVIRTGGLQWKASSLMNLRGPFIDGLANALVKIDGRQVHMD